MTRPNLETELLNTWNAEVAKLTPEEQAKLAATTPEEWARAIVQCITDPEFWIACATEFLKGLAGTRTPEAPTPNKWWITGEF